MHFTVVKVTWRLIEKLKLSSSTEVGEFSTRRAAFEKNLKPRTALIGTGISKRSTRPQMFYFPLKIGEELKKGRPYARGGHNFVNNEANFFID